MTRPSPFWVFLRLAGLCGFGGVLSIRRKISSSFDSSFLGDLAMPYVQRNLKGEITGMFANAQPGFAEEFLEENNPEVRAYHEKHPIPKDFLKPLSPADAAKRQQSAQALAEERRQTETSVVDFMNCWADLESELAHLFYTLLAGSREQLAFAAYFTIANFRSRLDVVDALVDLSVPDDQDREKLIAIWSETKGQISTLAGKRNKIAHGRIMTVVRGTKNRIRITPPVLNFLESKRSVDKRQIPGLGLKEIRQFAIKAMAATSIVEQMCALIATIYSGSSKELPKTIDELETRLQHLRSLSDPNRAKPKAPPRSSRA